MACGEGPPSVAAGGLERAKAAAVAIETTGQDPRGAFVVRGAGTILHAMGYVLTCEHVTVAGEQQHVVLADGRRFPFRVLARAGHDYDLAILRFDAPAGLAEVELGRNSRVAPGDPVVLVGSNPRGGLQALTAIVDLPDCGGGTQLQVRDADVVPGYSGGPVLDRAGRQVAHIHVAIHTAKGISRHIKIDHARQAFRTVLQDAAFEALGLRIDCSGRSARVVDVRPASAATRAGIVLGDEILRAGDMAIRTGIDWVLFALDAPPGTSQPIRLRRAGVPHGVTLRPAAARAR